MRKAAYDPAYVNSLRETAVIAAVFVVALGYTTGYCYLFGYGRDPAEIVSYYGIPSWVVWGVFLPWAACVAFTTWFCFFFMAEDPLDPDGEAPPQPDAPERRAGGGA